MKPLAEHESKKTYASPVLTIYGNIRVMTQSVGFNGNTDGGGAKAANKTRA